MGVLLTKRVVLEPILAVDFLDPSKSYLDRRRHIVKNIWKNATNYEGTVLPALRRFCQLYLPEDIDTLEEIFEKSLDQRIIN